jgi:hypothetical protein
MTPIADISPYGNLSPLWSIIADLMACTLVPLGLSRWMGLGCLRAWRRAVRERDAQDPGRKLVPGVAVLFGVVELASRAQHAVRVDIRQTGHEYRPKYNLAVEWKEAARKVHAEPFYVRDVRGLRVRVEPPADVRLIRELDHMQRIDLVNRVRSAVLTAGEVVYARGNLVAGHDPEASGGYRSEVQSLVLRRGPTEPMVLSSEPLTKRLRFQSAIYLGFGLVMLALLVFFQTQVPAFRQALVQGESEVGTVASRRTSFTENAKGRKTYYYSITVGRKNGQTVEAEVDSASFAHAVQGASIYLVAVPGKPESTLLGRRPTVGIVYLILPSVLTGVVALLCWLVLRGTRPWYEQPQIVDYQSGRLQP